jgi:alkylhydroperoxidase/carboxymuconolactone decarboxylase family protein YurZ
MDEHTEIFVALGAATAANCGPCFEHYFSKAEKLGISKDDIRKTVDIAVKVKGGAQMVMTGAIERTMKQNAAQAQDCCSRASGCCD